MDSPLPVSTASRLSVALSFRSRLSILFGVNSFSVSQRWLFRLRFISLVELSGVGARPNLPPKRAKDGHAQAPGRCLAGVDMSQCATTCAIKSCNSSVKASTHLATPQVSPGACQKSKRNNQQGVTVARRVIQPSAQYKRPRVSLPTPILVVVDCGY